MAAESATHGVTGCRDSLIAFLREQLKPDTTNIEPEYRPSGTTTDIYVTESGFFGSSEVFVELKRNLTQKAQLDRLVGQIASLQPDKNNIIVVLCRKTNPALLSRFKELFRLDRVMWSKLTVVLKPAMKPAKSR